MICAEEALAVFPAQVNQQYSPAVQPWRLHRSDWYRWR